MRSISFAILSALLLILCFPKLNIGYLAWFALVPLLIAIKDRSLKSAFGICFIAGMIFYPGIFYWFKLIKGVGWTEFLLIDVYVSSCYFGLFGLGLCFICANTRFAGIIVAPALWVSLEYVRSYASFLSHPQMLIGHSQYLSLPVIQISEFTGVYGVSFLIVMVNVALSELIHHRTKVFKSIIVIIIVLGMSIVYGLCVVEKDHGNDAITVSVIQGNILPEVKWKREFLKQNLNKHVRLTKNVSNNDNASLIVWPEASAQGDLKHDLLLIHIISKLAREIGNYLLVGGSQSPKLSIKERKEIKEFKNTAFLFSPEGKIMGEYDKIHLLPFGEYLPYKDYVPWPARIASKAGNFTPGNEYTVFNMKKIRFSTVICWEILYPELFRRFVRNGAEFMLNITNVARLGDTAAPYQFMAMSVFRAVENRVSVVRAANTGISCFINPYGNIMGKVHDSNGKETFVEGYLTMNIPLSHARTFYTMYGDIFVYVNMFAATIFIGLACFKNNVNR